MFDTQSNIKAGQLPVVAGEDLTGKEGLLAKIQNNAGAAEAALPGDNADETLFLIVEGAAAGKTATLMPLTPDRQIRAFTAEALNPADLVALADVGTPADKGKIRKLPGAAGSYFSPGIAEEAAEAGQLALIRPFPLTRAVA